MYLSSYQSISLLPFTAKFQTSCLYTLSSIISSILLKPTPITLLFPSRQWKLFFLVRQWPTYCQIQQINSKFTSHLTCFIRSIVPTILHIFFTQFPRHHMLLILLLHHQLCLSLLCQLLLFNANHLTHYSDRQHRFWSSSPYPHHP